MLKYKLFLIFCLKIICICQLTDKNSYYINGKDFEIKNAVYIIRNREGNVNLENINKIEFINTKSNLKKNFLIIKDNKKDNSEIFYLIKDQEKNTLLCAEKEGNKLTFHSTDVDKNYALWSIKPKITDDKKLIYYVQNKQNKFYWEIHPKNNSYELALRNISNTQDLSTNNEFLFIELFQYVNQQKSDLLEKEPIDVLIKYIDLSDESLNRTGIHKINKDYENGELKYCVRSILQNIPWIRKIFILMPNERVRYFKPKEQIEDKIVYVKDKDLLGFDSGNSLTFQYNLYKMKNFGLSENFILMDDDYFIAKPISKNELFYEENGEIFPAIITSDFYEMNKQLIIQQLEEIKKKKTSGDPHSPEGFYISQKKAFLFLYDLIGNDEIRNGKKMIEPAFSHNASPLKLSDIEEINKYIQEYYEYGNLLLYSVERSSNDLQFQTLYWAFVKNKYNRKVNKISSEFYDLTQSGKIVTNTKKLFVINTSSRNYNQIHKNREKDMLKMIFPFKTPYEIDEEKEKKIMISKSIVNSIMDLLINEVSNKLQSDGITNTNGFNLRKTIFQNNDKYENKIILREEIEYMKKQCRWQEMINFILIFFFFIMLIYRYFKK